MQDALEEVIAAAGAAYAAHVNDPGGQASIARIFAALAVLPEPRAATPARRPATRYFAQAADPAHFRDRALSRLAAALIRLEPSFTWRARGGGGANASENYPDGHANAMIIGPGGLVQVDHVWLGLSLLAPHVRYPDHDHAPEETYLVLSDGDFSQDGVTWFTPGPGGTFYNPPGILHAMRSGAAPLLAMWALWRD